MPPVSPRFPAGFVLLMGSRSDPHLLRLCAAIKEHGVGVERVDSRSQVAFSFRPDRPSDSIINGVFAGDVISVHVRALPPRQQALMAPPPHQPLSGEEWIWGMRAGQGLRDPLCAFFSHWEEIGRKVLNPPWGGDMVENKAIQLHKAHAIGLDIPKTQITADTNMLRLWHSDLSKNGGKLIYKPVRGGDFARILNPPGDPSWKLSMPFIVQEQIVGENIRVILLEGRLLSAYRIDGLSAVDHRADPKYQKGDFDYVPVVIPEALLQQLVAFQQSVHLPFCGVDLIRSLAPKHKGQWFFLEANGAPSYLESEDALGSRITQALAGALAPKGSAKT
jgi:glutathione synthase/RimK-type ligase-like ATP-grasp enzyme